ncbi:MAG TPA: hypothetical protein VGO91_08005 [Pyrinomonadaceae bacterium]|jgi:hypothetical protein|nr:hypothetical protein [Pyrinomonadaceae bacterium]
MRPSGTVILSLMILLALSNVSAMQQDAGWVVIKTETGVLLVWNQPQDYFTLAVKGKEIRPVDSQEHLFLSVDGTIFQVQSVAISDFLKDVAKQKQDEQSILNAHKNWEAQYIESLLGKKLHVEAAPQKLKDEKEALLWSVEQPEGFNHDAKKQLYLTMVNGDHVLLLNGVVMQNGDESAVRKFLFETLSTLKVSATKINVREVQDALRRARP